MSPQTFTNDLLIGWGGPEVFNQGLRIVRDGCVSAVEWDDRDHVVHGTITQRNGWDMKLSFEVLDDGTVRSHCPCRTNQEFGQVCPHVVALGLMLMLRAGDPDEPTESSVEFPPEALATKEAPVEVVLEAEYFEEDGQFCLFPMAQLPCEHIASQDRYLVRGKTGFVQAAGRWFPIKRVVSGPFQCVYTQDQFITREAMPSFIKNNLPLLRRQTDVRMTPSEDMFRFVPDHPKFRVLLSGSRASLSAEVTACYGKQEVGCCGPAAPDAICRPDPEDMLLYHVRNPFAEAAASALVKGYGFEAGTGGRFYISESRGVLNFLGSGVPFLRRRGWRIEFSDKLEALFESMPMIVPVVTVTDAPRGAFDVGYSYDADGRAVPPSEIQAALNRGDSYILKDGATFLVDTESIVHMRDVFADCATSQGYAAPGRFRVAGIYAPYVRASLDALDGIDLVAEHAPAWYETSARQNRDESAKLEPVDLGPLETVLRPYQKLGVYWMRFLEKSGLSGLLADEMGLGKTLQTLTWLSLERTDPDARGKPALVVCPTSLVRNWESEAKKFTPDRKCLVVSGPDRADVFKRIPEADLLITSYALLQRDFEEAYAGVTFSVVVLDEAQHIKNRSTRNAKSAKRLTSIQKLVLTGTPVENSVADVWSVFDFLLPDYLGDYETFRETTEKPIADGGKAGLRAQEKLRHKLHPFILRRLKKDVAKDLPDKIVSVRACPMTEEQQRCYNRLLVDTRGRIGDMVKAKGFAKSKFEILALLMRLRQVASHVGLLKEYREGTRPLPEGDLSGKTDVFLELLDEAMDAGHRVLVFSQFVTMLGMLRKELDMRGIRYCYLDGATKDRLGECARFNRDSSIPLFLISLHAGGTGLNLTGADMVVHFDPWWNPAVEDQATDRAHRIGQKRTVYVVKMIAENSVEERVLALQKKKQLVIDATVGTTDAQVLEKLTYDDVKSIIGI